MEYVTVCSTRVWFRLCKMRSVRFMYDMVRGVVYVGYGEMMWDQVGCGLVRSEVWSVQVCYCGFGWGIIW